MVNKDKSDAKRLSKLLKNYKRMDFHKSNESRCIECDGVSIRNVIERVRGNWVIKYDVSIDGKPFKYSDKLNEQIRDVYNRVYYCEPDDTPFHERFLCWVGYLAVCGILFATAFGATHFCDQKDVKRPEKAVVDKYNVTKSILYQNVYKCQGVKH